MQIHFILKGLANPTFIDQQVYAVNPAWRIWMLQADSIGKSSFWSGNAFELPVRLDYVANVTDEFTQIDQIWIYDPSAQRARIIDIAPAFVHDGDTVTMSINSIPISGPGNLSLISERAVPAPVPTPVPTPTPVLGGIGLIAAGILAYVFSRKKR